MTPYPDRTECNHWNICAIKLKGTIYLSLYRTDEQRHNEVMTSKATYWGWKAEIYLTSDKPEEKPTFNSCIDINSEYVSVFRANIGRVLPFHQQTITYRLIL